ncbi:MAG: S28 family serine protease, partial [Bdellovibrionota bacterium]
TGPWIAVGGSYAGNLAAYLRSQYPLDFAAALASSAPVLPDRDFSEYDRHVARMAGVTCTKAINTVVADIEAQIKTDVGFQAARSLFMADTVSRRDDFLYLLADIASAAIQYGMRDDFCNTVEAQGQAGYVTMKKKVDQLFGNFADYSAEAAENIAVANHSGALGMRQWFYQSCTEYGYWQNADAKESMRSKQINASYHDELCRRLFNFQKAGPVDSILRKLYEPLLNPALTSRILYTSGSVDPWNNLSIINENGNNVNPNTEAFLMQGAAHCDDLGRGQAADVKVAIQRFRDLLPTWIK